MKRATTCELVVDAPGTCTPRDRGARVRAPVPDADLAHVPAGEDSAPLVPLKKLIRPQTPPSKRPSMLDCCMHPHPSAPSTAKTVSTPHLTPECAGAECEAPRGGEHGPRLRSKQGGRFSMAGVNVIRLSTDARSSEVRSAAEAIAAREPGAGCITRQRSKEAVGLASPRKGSVAVSSADAVLHAMQAVAFDSVLHGAAEALEAIGAVDLCETSGQEAAAAKQCTSINSKDFPRFSGLGKLSSPSQVLALGPAGNDAGVVASDPNHSARLLAVKNARIIQQLIQECGDGATKCHDKWSRHRNHARAGIMMPPASQECQAGAPAGGGGDAARSETEAKKAASRLRMQRKAHITHRLADSAASDNSQRHAKRLSSILVRGGCRDLHSPHGEGHDGSLGHLLHHHHEKLVVPAEGGEMDHDDFGSRAETPLSPPPDHHPARLDITSCLKPGAPVSRVAEPPEPRDKGHHLGDNLDADDDSSSVASSGTRRLHFHRDSLRETQDKRETMMQQLISNRMRMRLPEVPRLRSKFRNQQVILGGQWRAQANTLKHFHTSMAENLGLDPGVDWDPRHVYSIGVAELERAAAQKQQRVRAAAAEKLQARWRGCQLYRGTTMLMARRRAAAKRLQAWWRHRRAYRLPVAHRLVQGPRQRAAAARLQALARGWSTRRRLRTALELHSVMWRMRMLQQELPASVDIPSIVRLQARIRGRLARSRLKAERERAASAKDGSPAAPTSHAPVKETSFRRRISFQHVSALGNLMPRRRVSVNFQRPDPEARSATLSRRASDLHTVPAGGFSRDFLASLGAPRLESPSPAPSPRGGRDTTPPTGSPGSCGGGPGGSRREFVKSPLPPWQRFMSDDNTSDGNSNSSAAATAAVVDVPTIGARAAASTPLAERLKSRPLDAGVARMFGMRPEGCRPGSTAAQGRGRPPRRKSEETPSTRTPGESEDAQGPEDFPQEQRPSTSGNARRRRKTPVHQAALGEPSPGRPRPGSTGHAGGSVTISVPAAAWQWGWQAHNLSGERSTKKRRR